MDTPFGERLFRCELWLLRRLLSVRLFSSTQMAEDFAWFSNLGWPDVKGLPFVRVPVNVHQVLRRRLMPQKYWRGFLLGESESGSTVFLNDLRRIQIPRGDREADLVVERVELKEEAERYLRFFEDPENWALEGNYRFSEEPLPEAVEMFVFAWACHRNGEERIAGKLYKQAWLMREGHLHDDYFASRFETRVYQLLGKAPKRRSLREQLESELSAAWLSETVLTFKELTVSRFQLLIKFEKLVQHFPGSDRVVEAQRYISTLRRMIKEDEEHARPWVPFSEMTREEQITELIFQLRDQAGTQLAIPGQCDIFEDPRGESSPAAQLARMGYDAVPKLFGALDDQTLSRCVEREGSREVSIKVLTVGECALAILGKISGRTNEMFSTVDKTPRQAAQEWWQGVQEKGAIRMLVEGLESGGQDAYAQAEILLTKDQAALCAALPIGCEHAANGWYKKNLIQIAAKIPGDVMVPFLEEQMQGAGLFAAVTAAWYLHQRGNSKAVSAMINRWKGSLPTGDNFFDGLRALAGFLVACRDRNAIAALATDFHQHSEAARLAIMRTLANGGWLIGLDDYVLGLWEEGESEKLPPEALLTIEKLAIGALEDTATEHALIGVGRKRMSNPRVCDYAGKLLAEQWKGKYTFDFFADKDERDRQRVECINVWRREQVSE